MSDYNGPWADERRPGHPIIDCVITSFLNGANVESDGAKPATDAEVARLRALTGDTSGGETLAAGDLGIHRAYGWPMHAVADTWVAINAALEAGDWVVFIGKIGALPPWIPHHGADDVEHACLYGPASQFVDPTDVSGPHGEPATQHLTRAEAKAFSATGGHDARVIVPHSHAAPKPTHGIVTKRPGHFFPYTLTTGGWTRPRLGRLTGGFSAVTTLRRRIPVMGKMRWMVQVKTGFLKGQWVDLAQMSSYKEV